MNILLVCAAGASSTCMAQRMNRAARQMGRDDINVRAQAEYEMEGYLDDTDVCLIGPHLKAFEKNIKEIAAEYHVPVGCISSEVYGNLDGEKGILEALSLFEEVKHE